MKVLFLTSSLILSSSAFADAYWTCQCFEDVKAAVSLAGVDEIPGDEAATLADAQKKGLEACKAVEPSLTVVQCLRFVKSDH